MAFRVLAISSGGGHWTQLRRLSPAFEGMDVAFASIGIESANDVTGTRFYPICEFTRFRKRNFFRLLFQILRILIHERPDAVITTGQGPALLTLGLAKYLFRSKTIWIESIANCEQLSTSGTAARFVADIWLTQWEHLSKEGGPAFWGQVI